MMKVVMIWSLLLLSVYSDASLQFHIELILYLFNAAFNVNLSHHSVIYQTSRINSDDSCTQSIRIN